jgi:endonuclease G
MKRKTTPPTIPIAVLLFVALAILVLRSLNRGGPSQPEGPAATRVEGPDRDRGAPPPEADAGIHLTMGNPSGATPDPADADNYLMRKPYFTLSYNNSRGTPNWVSWCLKEGDLGPAPRAQFYPDSALPDGFRRVFPRDYNSSGFDRGHMCPRSDRTSTLRASEATFVMTNIIPQSPACNQNAWANMEDYCRDLVMKRHQTLYIVAGPQGTGGEGTDGPKDSIADGKVTVPAKCWKVVLAVDGGTGGAEDVGRVDRQSRVIAVVMPNDQSVGEAWAKFRTRIKDVEELTGYHFFDRVPAEVMGPLKEKVDRERISAGRPERSEE